LVCIGQRGMKVHQVTKRYGRIGAGERKKNRIRLMYLLGPCDQMGRETSHADDFIAHHARFIFGTRARKARRPSDFLISYLSAKLGVNLPS
jgi:hypothetical protein